MLQKELALGITVYSCDFFKKINYDGSIHVSEDGQHDLIYWQPDPELFHF